MTPYIDSSGDSSLRTSGIETAQLSDGSRPSGVKLTYGKSVLHLSAGANQIQWAYQLKTNTKSTYGGEVTQVLGAAVGPLKISGNTRSMAEYESIRQWVVGVMTALGTGERKNEQPVLFEYPERGWSFWIMPTDFGPWQLDNRLVATEWFLSAEMVSPTSNALGRETMKRQQVGMPDSGLLAPYAFDHWRKLFDPGNAAGNFFTGSDIESKGNSIDKMLAHLVGGGFDLFGRTESEGATETPEDVYTGIFGSKWLVPPSGVDGATGDVALGAMSTKLEIVAGIVAAWEAKGMPGRLGVATGLGESNLNPDSWNGDYLGIFQTNHLGRGGSSENKAEIKAAYDAAKAVQSSAGETQVPAISEKYPAAMQITDAAEWFKDYAPAGATTSFADKAACLAWAEAAQGAPGQFIWWDRVWKEADELMKQAKAAGTAVGGAPSGSPKNIIDTIVVPLAASNGMSTGITAKMVEEANARHSQNTTSGNTSDHKGPPDRAWASDMSNGTAPTPEMDALAAAIAERFGIPWTGSGLVNHSVPGYRYQLIYRTNEGGNHYNHVHFGVRRD